MKGDSPFMPRPGQLRKLALDNGVSPEAEAIIEWHELDAALGRYFPKAVNGRWVSTDGSDMGLSPMCVAVAKSIGGFMRLKDMPLSELDTWKRKEFIAAYVALRKNPDRLIALAGPKSEIGSALLAKMDEKLQVVMDDDARQLESQRQLLSMLN